MAFILDSSWIHDPELVENLADEEADRLVTRVWRATGRHRDPLAFSYNGGRWAPPSSITSVPVLYTSLAREGAIAEMASWLAMLSPPPSNLIKVHELRVTANAVVRLTKTRLSELGVDVQSFEERNYAAMDDYPPSRTQEIGAALSFLGVNGLIVPSARFQCENLILFDNQDNSIEIEDFGAEDVDWKNYF